MTATQVWETLTPIEREHVVGWLSLCKSVTYGARLDTRFACRVLRMLTPEARNALYAHFGLRQDAYENADKMPRNGNPQG